MPASLTSVGQVPGIERLITDAVKSAVASALEKEIEEAKAKVEREIRASVGSVAARVLERFSFERMGSDLVIRVQFDGLKHT